MGFFSKFVGGKLTAKNNDVNDWRARRRQFATLQLAAALETLLIDGYEKDPSIRARGPLVEDWPNAIAWFGASQVMLVTDFVRSRTIWQGEEAEPVARCRHVIHAWCVKHGATVEQLQRCEDLLHEGLQQFRPVFMYSNLEETLECRDSFLEWADSLPEIRDNFGRITVFLADDGLVCEYFGNRKALFNDP